MIPAPPKAFVAQRVMTNRMRARMACKLLSVQSIRTKKEARPEPRFWVSLRASAVSFGHQPPAPDPPGMVAGALVTWSVRPALLLTDSGSLVLVAPTVALNVSVG